MPVPLRDTKPQEPRGVRVPPGTEERAPGPRRWRFRLALLAALGAGGLSLLAASGYLSLPHPWEGTKSITLTGKNRAGQLEVPVLNLWTRPGFGADNQVQARVSLPPTGEVKGQLLAGKEVQGLTWYEIKVQGGTGWVFARFVME